MLKQVSAVAGREHRFVYTAAALHPTKNMPQQALAKVDAVTSSVTMWSQGVHYYVGEPVFVPSPSGELRIYCNPKGLAALNMPKALWLAFPP